MRFLDAQRNHLRSIKQIDDKSDCFYRIHGYFTAIDSYGGYLPYFMADSNDGTQWVSSSWLSGGGIWFKLDLGSPKIITKIRFLQVAGGLQATQYKLEVSNDDTNWFLFYTSPPDLPGGEEILYPSCLKYRYWKVTELASNYTYGWQVFAFEVFGPVT